MPKYENAPGYPEFEERDEKGNPKFYPMLGYPEQMLNVAMGRDDVAGYRFYFDRYFSLDAGTLGGSIVLIAANRGAPNIVRELIKIGAKGTCYTPDELIDRATAIQSKRMQNQLQRKAA